MKLSNLSRNEKILAAVLVALLISLVAVVVYSQTMVIAPEHVTGNPEPTPTPTATATPTPTPETLELHLSSNNTTPFYQGDVLHLTATLTPAAEGVNVTLYNNGVAKETVETDASGVATFDRQCFNPFDFTAAAEIP